MSKHFLVTATSVAALLAAGMSLPAQAQESKDNANVTVVKPEGADVTVVKPDGAAATAETATKPAADTAQTTAEAAGTATEQAATDATKPAGEATATTDATKPAGDATATTDATKPAGDATATTDAMKPAGDATATTETTKPAGDATATTEKPVEEASATAETPPPGTEGTPVEGQIFEQSPDSFLASTLLDASVVSVDGETIGDVSDLVLDSEGSIEGVVVGVGGFLGIGKKSVALQFDTIDINQMEDSDLEFVLNTTKEQLEAAPEFKTQEDVQREAEAAQAQAQAPIGGGVAPPPLPGDPAAAPAN